jgi:hypothetical protein
MTELKVGDVVYIKSWDTYGKLIHVGREGGEPEKEKSFEVQANAAFFRRSDLELISGIADIQARQTRIRVKVARLGLARKSLQQALMNGAIQPRELTEYLAAADEIQKEMGYKALFSQ